MHAILHILALATVATSMPIDASTDSRQNTQQSPDLDAQNVLHLFRRSTCAPDANGVVPPDCSQVNSVLRAIFAISCLFIFLVLIHVWQATKFNKIHSVLGTYVADDMVEPIDTNIPYIKLSEPDSP